MPANVNSDASDANVIDINVADATYNSIIHDTTMSYLYSIDKQNPPSPSDMERDLLNEVNHQITLANLTIPSIEIHNPDGSVQTDKHGNPKTIPLRNKWKPLDRLVPQQLADIVMFFNHVIRVDTTESNVETEEDLIGIYCDDGPNKGVYDTNESRLYDIVKRYDYQLEERKFKEVAFMLQSQAPRKTRCCNKDFVPVNNGIFDYKTKQLLDFDPQYVYLTKSSVNYNPNAVNVVIHNDDDGTDWDVESWMQSLSDDPDIVELFWNMLSAIIRPFVRWNKSVWMYSNTGNNGKGTLCELMRNLCGPGSHTSISLSEFDKEFALQPLVRSTAIIVDENDVGQYIDKLANLKAVVTNDIVQINRKFKAPISFRFWGFMVQCINDLPRIRDKSDSFYRRQILVPMEKCFTGVERPYIKNDYLHRPEVLEYVMKKVLSGNFYELTAPQKCKDLLGAYKELNDPVREFINEFMDQFQWDLLPFDFIYDLYKAWYQECNPSGRPEGKNTMKRELTQLILSDPDLSAVWYIPDNAVYTRQTISCPEPLLLRYDLENWVNPNTKTSRDRSKAAMPYITKDRMRGIVRKAPRLTTMPSPDAGTVAVNTVDAQVSDDGAELFHPDDANNTGKES